MSKFPSTFQPARKPGQAPTYRDASDFLRGNEKLAALLPTATRLAKLQQDCLTLMPGHFANCTVLQITDEELQIALPNAALATRIKQMLPKLHAGLREKGWQITGIKLKIRVIAPPLPPPSRELELPGSALASFAALDQSLEKHPRNGGLKEAIHKLLARRMQKQKV
jgi:hypothetical protein